jgi:hypothetical protein
MFQHPLGCAALAGGIAVFKQNHDALPSFFDSGLKLEQLHLQQVSLGFVNAAREQVFVGVGGFSPVSRELLVGVDALGRCALVGLGLAFEQLPDGLGVVGRGSFRCGSQRFCLLRLAELWPRQDVTDCR